MLYHESMCVYSRTCRHCVAGSIQEQWIGLALARRARAHARMCPRRRSPSACDVAYRWRAKSARKWRTTKGHDGRRVRVLTSAPDPIFGKGGRCELGKYFPRENGNVIRYFSVRLRRREGKKERESPHPVSVSPSLLVASYFIIDYLGFRRRS